MADERYDVLVVGAGIHGAGVAQAAAARGHRVLVLERQGIASATSSRSSKLVHGGLRYLESGRFGLVAESLRERAVLLRLAPGLVALRPFYVPVFEATRRRPATVRLGLSLYALLGGLRRENRFAGVPRRDWDSLDGLRTEGLRRVFVYRDAQTDDAALCAAVMRSAQSLGAELRMPARFVAARLDGEGCLVEYEQGSGRVTCRAAALVNAAGPWIPQVLARIDPAPPRRPVDLVQGAHIVLREAVAGGVYYVESPRDGRAVFVMPWRGGTLVGTTETPFAGDPGAVAALPEEQSYLAEVAGHYFPRLRASEPGAVTGSFAGLRVLPSGAGPCAGRSRETILDTDRERAPRVITIYGGKLTTYRSTAQKVMDRIRGSLPARRPVADTRELPLAPPP